MARVRNLQDRAGQQPAGTYARIASRRWLLLAGLAGLLVASLTADLLTGPSGMPLSTLFDALFAPSTVGAGERVILWSVRLPYALMAVVVGAALGLAGAETQTALDNPLASPYTLGISWAANLGAVLAIVLGLDAFGVPTNVALPASAFVLALIAGMGILLLAQAFGSNTETIILFGIAIVFLCTALISLLQFVADADDVQQSVLWSMGSIARATHERVAIVAICLALVIPFSMRAAWAMTLLRAGEAHAAGAGLSVHRLRLGAMFRASLLAATGVAFVGTIGFVGLVGPHVARLLLGEDQRYFLPGAALTGALMLSLASVASKSIVPGALVPVGIVTALVGIPVFVTLVVYRRRGR